jgi:hypothetical protein
MLVATTLRGGDDVYPKLVARNIRRERIGSAFADRGG